MLGNQVNQIPKSNKPFWGRPKPINCSTFDKASEKNMVTIQAGQRRSGKILNNS